MSETFKSSEENSNFHSTNAKLSKEARKSTFCTLCKKSFASKQNLKCHIKNVHDKVKDFNCDSCDKTFGRSTELKSHKTLVHDTSKAHRCEFCGKQGPRSLRKCAGG